MPSLFQQGVDTGSNMLNVQQGLYACSFDAPTGVPTQLELTFSGGDEILDLTDPESPVAPAGLYFASSYFYWSQNETGASVQLTQDLTPVNWVDVVDLGVGFPNGDPGAQRPMTGVAFASDDGNGFFWEVLHNRATDNLTGGFQLLLTRLY